MCGAAGSVRPRGGVADKASRAGNGSRIYSRIGSETKAFTVTAVLQLADQGKVGLGDPIAKYVDLVLQGDRITLRQLARMQVGLYNYSDGQRSRRRTSLTHIAISAAGMLGYVFARPAVSSPGQAFRYCHTISVLRGLVVEKLSGQSFPLKRANSHEDPH
jgi:D-alanyl-D-alanine carboxypeptidase